MPIKNLLFLRVMSTVVSFMLISSHTFLETTSETLLTLKWVLKRAVSCHDYMGMLVFTPGMLFNKTWMLENILILHEQSGVLYKVLGFPPMFLIHLDLRHSDNMEHLWDCCRERFCSGWRKDARSAGSPSSQASLQTSCGGRRAF